MSLLSKAIKDLAEGAGNAYEDATGAGQDAANDVADAFKKAGKQLVDTVGDLAVDLAQVINDNMIGIRSLRPAERSLVHRVYEDSLPPLDRLLVVSLAGIDGRAFTVPASLLANLAGPLLWPVDLMLLQMAFRATKTAEYYLLFMGRRGYSDAIHRSYDNLPGDTLIHEVGHVWQGFNAAFTWGYVFNSVYYQSSGGAYDYTPGQQWDTYGAEQQAKIVEDWFAAFESTSSSLYPYIRSNVRPGKPHATTDFSSGVAGPATSAAMPSRGRPAPPPVIRVR